MEPSRRNSNFLHGNNVNNPNIMLNNQTLSALAGAGPGTGGYGHMAAHYQQFQNMNMMNNMANQNYNNMNMQNQYYNMMNMGGPNMANMNLNQSLMDLDQRSRTFVNDIGQLKDINSLDGSATSNVNNNFPGDLGQYGQSMNQYGQYGNANGIFSTGTINTLIPNSTNNNGTQATNTQLNTGGVNSPGPQRQRSRAPSKGNILSGPPGMNGMNINPNFISKVHQRKITTQRLETPSRVPKFLQQVASQPSLGQGSKISNNSGSSTTGPGQGNNTNSQNSLSSNNNSMSILVQRTPRAMQTLNNTNNPSGNMSLMSTTANIHSHNISHTQSSQPTMGLGIPQAKLAPCVRSGGFIMPIGGASPKGKGKWNS